MQAEVLRRLATVAVMCCALSPRVAESERAPDLELDARGVVLRLSDGEELVLPVPGLQRDAADYAGERPSVELMQGGAVASYASGATLLISTSGRSITYVGRAMPSGARALIFTMAVPAAFKLGGSYRADSAPVQRFPDRVRERILWQGRAQSLELVAASGVGIRLVVPPGFQQLQDGRAFGAAGFFYVHHFSLPRGPGEVTFTFTVEPHSTEAAPRAAGARRFAVDRYGQSALRDYPEKVRSDRDLVADIAKHKALLEPEKGRALDAFGGLAGSREQFGLNATGYFHVARAAERQVLVTPAGNLFFQLGVCGISITDDYTQVGGREHLYEWLPTRDGDFASALRPSSPGVVSFYISNWVRKYQKPFDMEAWTRQVVTRVRAWGFNSAGAFSSRSEAMHKLGFPVVGMLPLRGDQGLPMLPEKVGSVELLDPFAPDVERKLDRLFAATIAKTANDPLIIGYFQGNEQHLELLPRLIPTLRASQAAAKIELIRSLRAKYGEVARFNEAWAPARPFSSFDQLAEESLVVHTEQSASDMQSFYRHYLEHYYALVERVFRRHDPNHLLLGSRFTAATANDADVLAISGRHNDVISVNYYTYQIEREFLQRVHQLSGGRPILLSEWYYGSTERGLGGGKEVSDQNERALGYRNYVEQSAALPYVVGSEWFIYLDQALTGRFFGGHHGEGNNTGLVSVTDRPYEALVSATKKSGARVYDVMLGKALPFRFDDARFQGRPGGDKARVVTVPRAPTPISIDGTTGGWPGTPGEGIDPTRVVVGKRDARLGGDFRLCWDDQHLYFFIRVRDPSPGMNRRAPSSLWSADAVELFIGARDPERKGAPLPSDRQVLFGAGDKPVVYVSGHEHEGKQYRSLTVRDTAGRGYVVEAAIPWTVLGVRPEPGRELLFDVAIDNSADGLNRSQQLVWNGSARNSGDRSGWGRARLVEN